MSKFTSDIARAVRHELLDPEFITRKAGRIFWVKETTDANYTTFVAEHPAYEDGVAAVYTGLQAAFDIVGKNDAILVFPGNWTGNYTTPLNATAPFVSLIGINATDRGYGPWMGATVASTPILEVRARGWKIRGFEFDGPASSSCVKLTTSGTSNANFTQIDHCLFTGAGTGKYGIEWYGAPTYTYVGHNRFDGFAASGATAFVCTNSGTDVPRMCTIEYNEFQENLNHIAMNPRGFKMSVIRGNVFQQDGHQRNAVVLLDTRGGGGNDIVGNFFDCLDSEYKDGASTPLIRTAATDIGMGNWCSDGIPTGEIGH